VRTDGAVRRLLELLGYRDYGRAWRLNGRRTCGEFCRSLKDMSCAFEEFIQHIMASGM
jgi:hypothetical protein